MSEKQNFGKMASFYFPLALQNISQSFTYPLVAMVAVRGLGGPLNIAAIAQASSVGFLIFTLSSGIVTTGMIYLRSREGLARFLKVNSIFTLAIFAIHLCACIPFVGHFIFGTIMGLTEELERSTYFAFVLMLPLSLLFNIRNPYMVILFNEKKTGLAYLATFGRIIATITLSFVFVFFDYVGILWAVVCLSTPIVAEVLIIRSFALPRIKALPQNQERLISIKDMILFTFSFSIGHSLICLSGYMIGAFAARAPSPEIMLPVYYVVMGLFNPVAFGATRIQALVIGFANDNFSNRRLRIFALLCGGILGIAPLVFLLPYAKDWYYCILQRMPVSYSHYIRETSFLLVIFPFVVALRAYSEGWAAYHRKPVSMMAGQAVYLASVTCGAFFALNSGFAGNMIGPFALILGNMCAMATIMLSLKLEMKEEIPPSRAGAEFSSD